MKRILLSGGGTGGHIYPALAIANAVRRRYPHVQIAYIGTENGLEARIVPRSEDITFYTVKIQGFKRSLSLDNLRTIAKFVRAVQRSKEFLKEFRPDVVVGTGGYVSGPAVFAAHRLDIPTLIHEQNVVPGLTTRFLTRYADVTAVSFSSSEGYLENANRLVHTGNPRATEVIHGDAEQGRKSLELDDSDKPLVLFVGGSRGARPINEAVMEMVPRMAELPDVCFVYVTGEIHYEEIKRDLDGRAPGNLRIVPFVYNMPDVLGSDFAGGGPGRRFHPGGIDRPRHSLHPDSLTLCHQQPPGGERPLAGRTGGGASDSGEGVYGGKSVEGNSGDHEGPGETSVHGGEGQNSRPAEGSGGVGG